MADALVPAEAAELRDLRAMARAFGLTRFQGVLGEARWESLHAPNEQHTCALRAWEEGERRKASLERAGLLTRRGRR